MLVADEKVSGEATKKDDAVGGSLKSKIAPNSSQGIVMTDDQRIWARTATSNFE